MASLLGRKASQCRRSVTMRRGIIVPKSQPSGLNLHQDPHAQLAILPPKSLNPHNLPHSVYGTLNPWCTHHHRNAWLLSALHSTHWPKESIENPHAGSTKTGGFFCVASQPLFSSFMGKGHEKDADCWWGRKRREEKKSTIVSWDWMWQMKLSLALASCPTLR